MNHKTPTGFTWGILLHGATMAVVISCQLLMSLCWKDLASFKWRWQAWNLQINLQLFSFCQSVPLLRFLKREKRGVMGVCGGEGLGGVGGVRFSFAALSSRWQRCSLTGLHNIFSIFPLHTWPALRDAQMWRRQAVLSNWDWGRAEHADPNRPSQLNARWIVCGIQSSTLAVCDRVFALCRPSAAC